MTETVTVRIGGEDIALPLIANLAALKRVSPALTAWEEARTLIAHWSAAAAFVAALVAPTRPDLTLPVIEERLRVQRYDPATDHDEVDVDERPGLIKVVNAVCRASGLLPQKPPEPPAASGEEAKDPASEISTTSSPS
jgi:hypothetical protein